MGVDLAVGEGGAAAEDGVRAAPRRAGEEVGGVGVHGQVVREVEEEGVGDVQVVVGVEGGVARRVVCCPFVGRRSSLVDVGWRFVESRLRNC